jgi:hypothetical protein
MSPQFVDFNNDGKIDIVAGTFDGSPYVSYGSDKGFLAPGQILDAKGQRIVLNAFWNYDEKKWDDTARCNPVGKPVPKGQGTSAVAFDWDNDGDLDLLLGDHDSGALYRRMNDGKPGEAKFASVNLPVMAGDKPLIVGTDLATPRLVDWDGDGLMDLVCSNIGDAYGDKPGGGVFLYRNVGWVGSPVFAAGETVVPVGKKGGTAPTRPDSGLYPDVADFDGDGDLDLIVGGYSDWKPEQRALTDEESAKVIALRADLKVITDKQAVVIAGMNEAIKGLDGEAATKKRTEYLAAHKEELASLNKSRVGLQKQIDAYIAAPQHKSFVWLYENTAGKGTAKAEKAAAAGPESTKPETAKKE